mgnify:CR=1 FL=1
MNYFELLPINKLNKGDLFLFQNTQFELIYNEHAINVGLTTDSFKHEGKNQRQVMSFPDDEKVLIKVEKL